MSVMSERLAPARTGAREDFDPADPAFAAKAQQAVAMANENCDRAMGLAHKLSAELRAAHDRINQLELEADGLVDRLRADAKAAILKFQSESDLRVDRAKRDADERVREIQ